MRKYNIKNLEILNFKKLVIEGDRTPAFFLQDIFYKQKMLDIRTTYWGHTIPEEVIIECEKNFNRLYNLPINKFNYETGLDYFEFGVFQFLNNLCKKFPVLLQKWDFKIADKTKIDPRYVDGTKFFV